MWPGQAIRNEGVQRGVGALVDLGGQLVAVDQAFDGLTHGLGLVGVRLAGLLAVRHDLEVEGKEALFAARSLDDLDLGILGQIIDVGRSQRTVGHVDLSLLHGHLQVGGVGEVLDLHNVVLSWGQTLVGIVLGICQGLVHLVGGELVRACEGVVLDDGVGIGQLVGGEGLFVDDRAGRAGEHLLQGHVVLDRGVEHDGGVILGLDGLDVGQQGGRTVLVVDLLDTVEGELDVGGGQIVAVRELQALLELDGELGAVGAPGAVIGGDPIESRGIQLQQIARVAKYNPQGIPEDAAKKLAPVFNLDQMAESYFQQDADPVKSSGIQSKKVSYKWRTVTKDDMKDFNDAWWQIVKANPQIALDALFAECFGYFNVTDLPYVSMDYYVNNDYVQSDNEWIHLYNHQWRNQVAGFAKKWGQIPVLGWVTHGNLYITLTLLIGAAEVVLRRWRSLSWHLPLLLLMGVMITAPANNFERHMLPIAFVFGFLCLEFWRESRAARLAAREASYVVTSTAGKRRIGGRRIDRQQSDKQDADERYLDGRQLDGRQLDGQEKES